MIFESFMSFMNKIMLFSAYVNNASNFPKPLSLEEEKLNFEKFWAGDKKAKEILISHNLRLVAHIVKKYNNSGEADDLISVGSIGLIKAINTFQYGKNTQFSTYAARCIENEILMLLRVNKKHLSVMSLNECLGKDKEGNEICVMDILPNDESDVIESVENNILTEKLLKIIKSTLSDREYKIICMRYGLNNTPAYTQREIAKKLNISRSYISRLEKKAIDIMKEYVNKVDVYN
ncbi:MAG: RNA polymerase sporulation sigma factor SigK [Clostridia bacterium]|nr:RNA polymerase sporulation sigma factor SigK [Clostridia bacterium]